MNMFGKPLLKLRLMFLIFIMEAYFSSEILCTLHASNLDERLTEPLYTATLLITNRNENEEIVISLFKNF